MSELGAGQGIEQAASADMLQARGSGALSLRLKVARVVWLALAVLSLGLFAASLPAYFAQVQQPCTNATTCNLTGALTRAGLAQLSAAGLSTAGYATLLTIFFVLIVAIWGGIGFLIFWRRPNDWFALFSALFLVMFNATYPGFPITALALAHPALNLLISLLGALGVYSIIAFLVLFPNGRLVPRWMGVILALGALGAITTAFPNMQLPVSVRPPPWLVALFDTPQYLAIVVAQVYRYRKVSTSIERQQTKWVLFGIVIVMVGIGLPFPIFSAFVPAFNQSNTPLITVFGLVNYPLILLVLPITIGIAILRSRLYDIDVLINRALVYGSLTILLALLYFGMIVGLESLLRVFSGRRGESPIVLTLSTLLIATLVQPLRHRLQAIIDHRFYRHKYDASRTLAAFGARQRNEVDLNALSDHLIAVVQQTMQPAHVSLWLRSPATSVRQPLSRESDQQQSSVER